MARIFRLTVCLAGVVLASFPATGADQATVTRLGELPPDSVHQDWGGLKMGRSVWDKPLQIGDRKFDHGLGTHASSELVYDLDEGYTQFESEVGVDAAMRSYQGASVVFVVLGDGRDLFQRLFSGDEGNHLGLTRAHVGRRQAPEERPLHRVATVGDEVHELNENLTLFNL